MTLTKAQENACSGVAILYMGPEEKSDDLVDKLKQAMDLGDRKEAQHTTAMMICLMHDRVSPETSRFMVEQCTEAFLYDRILYPLPS